MRKILNIFLSSALVISALLPMGLLRAPLASADSTAKWNPPKLIDNSFGNSIWSVSCFGSNFCIAVDDHGNAIKYDGSSWSAPESIDPNGDLYSVSCVGNTFCMAVNWRGDAFKYDGNAWSSAVNIDSYGLTSVSCTSTSFCMAVDAWGSAFKYDGNSWSGPENIDGTNNITSVSCTSTSFCMAVDWLGYALNYDGNNWSNIGSLELFSASSISCTSTSFCMAVSYFGYYSIYDGSNWSTSLAEARWMRSVSCTSSTFCMAVDYSGNALRYNGSTWTIYSNISSYNRISAVSCTSTSFCMAIARGYAIPYSIPTDNHTTPGSPNTGLGNPNSSFKYVAALILGLGSIYGIVILVNNYRRARVNR